MSEQHKKRWEQHPCWEWTRAKSNGYGYIKLRGAMRSSLAHRVAFEAFRGPIPDGLQLDHLCRNRGCVNPWHLEPVDCRENLLRGNTTQAAINARKTHCPAGHPYDQANTYVKKDGARMCRECNRVRTRERARQRARELGWWKSTGREPPKQKRKRRIIE